MGGVKQLNLDGIESPDAAHRLFSSNFRYYFTQEAVVQRSASSLATNLSDSTKRLDRVDAQADYHALIP